IERDKLEITEGADALLVVGDDVLNDTRCASCGSYLFSVVRDGAYVHVGLGSLIDAPSIRRSRAADEIGGFAVRNARDTVQRCRTRPYAHARAVTNARPEYIEASARNYPMPRLCAPEDVAHAVLFPRIGRRGLRQCRNADGR